MIIILLTGNLTKLSCRYGCTLLGLIFRLIILPFKLAYHLMDWVNKINLGLPYSPGIYLLACGVLFLVIYLFIYYLLFISSFKNCARYFVKSFWRIFLKLDWIINDMKKNSAIRLIIIIIIFLCTIKYTWLIIKG